jgi:hypothetical protein
MKRLWIMLFCLLLSGCENLEQRKQKELDKDKHTIRTSFYLTTILHDEHLFILSHHGYFIHHLDCPCIKKQTEEKSPSPSPVIISSPNILDLLKP